MCVSVSAFSHLNISSAHFHLLCCQGFVSLLPSFHTRVIVPADKRETRLCSRALKQNQEVVKIVGANRQGVTPTVFKVRWLRHADVMENPAGGLFSIFGSSSNQTTFSCIDGNTFHSVASFLQSVCYNFFLPTVSYVRRSRRHQWRCGEVTLRCASRRLCEQWTRAIGEQLSLLSTCAFNDAVIAARASRVAHLPKPHRCRLL